MIDLLEFYKEARDLIECCDWFYLSTYNSKLNSAETRAMANMRSVERFPENTNLFCEDDLSTYIVTALSSAKIQQIKNNGTISLYYFCPKLMKSLSLFGAAEMVFDRELKNKLWQDEWKMYFSLGSEDPEYTILKFTPKVAKYSVGFQHIETISL